MVSLVGHSAWEWGEMQETQLWMWCHCGDSGSYCAEWLLLSNTKPLPLLPYYTAISYLEVWNIWSSKCFFLLHSSFATALWNSISNVWSQWRWRCGLWGIWEGGNSNSTANEHWESPQGSCQYWQHLQGLCNEMWHVNIFTIYTNFFWLYHVHLYVALHSLAPSCWTQRIATNNKIVNCVLFQLVHRFLQGFFYLCSKCHAAPQCVHKSNSIYTHQKAWRSLWWLP